MALEVLELGAAGPKVLVVGAVVALEVLELGAAGPEVLVVGAVGALEVLELGASGPEVLVFGAVVAGPDPFLAEVRRSDREVLELGASGPEVLVVGAVVALKVLELASLIISSIPFPFFAPPPPSRSRSP